MGADTSVETPAAPAGGDVAPAAAGAPAAPAAQAPAWSLDSWKEDQWDALPERIRLAADARYKGQYEPKLTEAQSAIAQREADLAAARREVQDAKTAHLRGAPYDAQRLTEARAEVERLKGEFDAHRQKYSPETFEAHKAGLVAEWNKAREEANKAYNSAVDVATMREIRVLAPWFGEKHGNAANPNYDADRTQTANELDNLLIDAGLDLPFSYALQASGLNAAQRNTLVTALANDVDPWTALKEASAPPRHQPSAASRAAPGAPTRTDPRPDNAVRPRTPFEQARAIARAAAADAMGHRALNADT